MSLPPPLLPEIDLSFLRRVYRTSVVVLCILGLVVWARFGPAAAVGLLIGGALSVLGLMSVEATVRRYLTPESQSLGSLAGASLAKLLGFGAVLMLAFLGAQRGLVSLVWILVGYALPHTVVALKLAGRKLVDSMGSGPGK